MTEITAAEQAIRSRIHQQDKITFAEFMQLALYHPTDGYYTSESPFGADGDYYTSPAAHPAFGALLGVNLFMMWRLMGEPSQFTVVEMGAGSGQLAHDITAYAACISEDFARRLRYICLDRYALAKPNSIPVGAVVHRLRSVGVPLRDVEGCFISNELVDSFPVHRFQMHGGELLEVYVTLNSEGSFTETLDKPSTSMLDERIFGQGIQLADGFCGEVRLNTDKWMSEVAHALGGGFVITIDYGYEASELYSHRLRHGTLQTYYRHTEGSSPYQRIGMQDISAHVDFSALQSDGCAAGLSTIAYMTQALLLAMLGMEEMLYRMRTMQLSLSERNSNLMALRELVKPDGLGGFKVLIQQKGTGINEVGHLEPPPELRQRLTAPLLSHHHMPLMAGRYPHMGWELQDLWHPPSA